MTERAWSVTSGQCCPSRNRHVRELVHVPPRLEAEKADELHRHAVGEHRDAEPRPVADQAVGEVVLVDRDGHLRGLCGHLENSVGDLTVRPAAGARRHHVHAVRDRPQRLSTHFHSSPPEHTKPLRRRRRARPPEIVPLTPPRIQSISSAAMAAWRRGVSSFHSVRLVFCPAGGSPLGVGSPPLAARQDSSGHDPAVRPGVGPLGVRKQPRHRHPSPDPHAGAPWPPEVLPPHPPGDSTPPPFDLKPEAGIRSRPGPGSRCPFVQEGGRR